METKTCTKCGESKPKTTEFFGVVSNRPCGFRGQCKVCYRKYDAQKYLENKEEKYERSNTWRKNNPEKVAIRAKKYVEQDPARYKQYSRNYYEKNAEIIKAKKKEYRLKHLDREKNRKSIYNANNRDKGRIHKAKRRQLKKNAQANFTLQDWNGVLSAFKNSCAYCGTTENLTQDHFIPLSKGGEYTINNIIPACGRCNYSKNNKVFSKWYPKQEYYSKQREEFLLKHLNYRDGLQQLALV